MHQNELQLAMMQYATERAAEPTFHIPRRALDSILAADNSLLQALTVALEGAVRGERNLYLPDHDVAVKLTAHGIVTPTDAADEYAFMDIAVR